MADSPSAHGSRSTHGVRHLQQPLHAPPGSSVDDQCRRGQRSQTRSRGPSRPTRPASSTRGRPSTTSSPSTRTSRPTRCSSAYLAARTERIHLGSGIFNITPPVNHPARVAERVAMLDHLSDGRFEFGIGPRLVDHRAARLRHHRPRDSPSACSTRCVREFKQMWARERVPASTASSSRCRRATCCRSRTRPAPADVGRGRQPGHVREGGADGPRRAVLHDRLARER